MKSVIKFVSMRKPLPKHACLWSRPGSCYASFNRNPLLDQVGAVVLDEFHERSVEMDLALGMLRRLREQLRPELRLIIMSATIQANELQQQLRVPKSFMRKDVVIRSTSVISNNVIKIPLIYKSLSSWNPLPKRLRACTDILTRRR